MGSTIWSSKVAQQWEKSMRYMRLLLTSKYLVVYDMQKIWFVEYPGKIPEKRRTTEEWQWQNPPTPLAPRSDLILLAFGRGVQTFVAPLVSGLFVNNFIFNPTISKTQAIGTTCPQPVFFGHLMISFLNDQKIKSISSYRLFYPITQISKNEKITNAFKPFRRYVRNVSVKKKRYSAEAVNRTRSNA